MNNDCKIMYNAIEIANFFIKKSLEEKIELTPMKLIKLVYISHGWCLGIKKTPLINEAIEAWQYGPVVKSVYDAFKHYGNDQITKTKSCFLWSRKLDDDSKELLNAVWDLYKSLNGLQLSTLTHKVGTPWNIARENNSKIISDSIIGVFYKNKIAKTSTLGN